MGALADRHLRKMTLRLGLVDCPALSSLLFGPCRTNWPIAIYLSTASFHWHKAATPNALKSNVLAVRQRDGGVIRSHPPKDAATILFAEIKTSPCNIVTLLIEPKDLYI